MSTEDFSTEVTEDSSFTETRESTDTEESKFSSYEEDYSSSSTVISISENSSNAPVDEPQVPATPKEKKLTVFTKSRKVSVNVFKNSTLAQKIRFLFCLVLAIVALIVIICAVVVVVFVINLDGENFRRKYMVRFYPRSINPDFSLNYFVHEKVNSDFFQFNNLIGKSLTNEQGSVVFREVSNEIESDIEYKVESECKCCFEMECSVDRDCDDGKECENGFCNQVECKSDWDCSENEVCLEKKCNQMYQSSGDDCIYDNHCRTDEVCKSGKCVIEPASECLSKFDCKIGEEICAVGKCIEVVYNPYLGIHGNECEKDLDCRRSGHDEWCVWGMCVSSAIDLYTEPFPSSRRSNQVCVYQDLEMFILSPSYDNAEMIAQKRIEDQCYSTCKSKELLYSSTEIMTSSTVENIKITEVQTTGIVKSSQGGKKCSGVCKVNTGLIISMNLLEVASEFGCSNLDVDHVIEKDLNQQNIPSNALFTPIISAECASRSVYVHSDKFNSEKKANLCIPDYSSIKCEN